MYPVSANSILQVLVATLHKKLNDVHFISLSNTCIGSQVVSYQICLKATGCMSFLAFFGWFIVVLCKCSSS